MIRLRHGEMVLELAPEVGGGIARLTYRRQDIFRAAPLVANDPKRLAGFPMVPFCGRVAVGRFAFGGQEVGLSTEPGEPHALHGQGWKAAWEVEDQGADHARLAFRYRARGWPWDYAAGQTFRLAGDALIYSLSLTNLSASVMPAGLGLHPYFPLDPDTQLQFSAPLYQPIDQTLLPLPPEPIPAAWDFNAPQAVTAPIDNPFLGWDGRARLTWPSRGLAVEVTTDPLLSHLVIYAPMGEAVVSIEPCTHPIGALNHSAQGMALLGPGESLAISVRFQVGAA